MKFPAVWSGVVSIVLVMGLVAGYRVARVTADAAPPREESHLTLLGGEQVQLIDLTHPFDDQTVYWPTEIPFHLERGFAGVTAGGWFYSANRFKMAEHSGTHLDAPIHFSRGAHTADEVALDRLVGPGVVVDVTESCQANPDFLATTAVFQEWETKHKESLAGKIVLLRTGYGKYWPDRKRYLGTEETGAAAVAKLHFPGVDPDAAAWLVGQRRIKALGIDTASIDRGQSKNFATHVVLCAHDTPILENVANLDRLPAKGFTAIALPMKIRGGSGGPLRIIAALPALERPQ